MIFGRLGLAFALLGHLIDLLEAGGVTPSYEPSLDYSDDRNSMYLAILMI